MQNEQLAIKTIASHFAETGSTAKKSADKNLIRILRDHVTYPPELIAQLTVYGAAFMAELQDYDDRILYNWDDYEDGDKRELIRLANGEAVKKLNPGLGTEDIHFVDFEDIPGDPEGELLGRWDMYEDEGGWKTVLNLSNKLLQRKVPEIVGLVAHEQGHGITTLFCDTAQEIVKGKSGIMWSKCGNADKFYLNPEEALVRAFETNVVECFAPGSTVAERIRERTLEKPGYAHMAASKQFFDFVKR